MKRALRSISALWIVGGFLLPRSWAVELPAEPFANLRSEEFRKRESAQAELLAWAREQREPAIDELFRQSRVADDPEVRERCVGVLRELVNDQFMKEGEGFLGISMQLVNEIVNFPGDPKPRVAVKVLQVLPDSAAQKAGLQFNDLIVGLGDVAWYEGIAYDLFRERIRQMKPDTKIDLKIMRNGNAMDVEVRLGRRPLLADNPFMGGSQDEIEAAERAAKDAYFRRWLELRKSAK